MSWSANGKEDAVFELKACIYTTVSLLVGLFCFRYCADRRLNEHIGRYFLPLMVTTQLAAFMSPTIIIYHLVVGAALIFACKRREMIAPTYLFLLVTLPIVSQVIAAGGTYLMAYDITITLGISALISLMMRSRGRFSRGIVCDIPVMLLMVLFIFLNARSTTLTNTFRVFLETVGAFLLPYLVISRSMRSFDDLRASFYGLIAGTSALSTLAVYEALHTWPLYRVVSDHYGIVLGSDASVKVRAGFLRSSGPFTEPTSFGYCLALGVLAAVGSRNLFPKKTRYYMILAILGLGVLAPQSRGAWLGVVAGIVAMELYGGQFGALAKKAGLGALAALMVLGLAKVDQRVGSAAGLTAEGQGTVEYRSDLLTRGMQEIRAHPLIGRPPADVRVALSDMTQGEGIIDFVNTYLFIGLVTGVPGLLLFVWAFVQPLINLLTAQWSLARRQLAAFRQQSSASLVFGGIAAVMVMIAVTSMTGRTTVLAVIEIGLAAVVINNMPAARRGMQSVQAGRKPEPAARMADAAL